MAENTDLRVRSLEISIKELDITNRQEIKNDIGALLLMIDITTKGLILAKIIKLIKHKPSLINLFCECRLLEYIKLLLVDSDRSIKNDTCSLLRYIVLSETNGNFRDTYLNYIYSSGMVNDLVMLANNTDPSVVCTSLFALSNIISYSSLELKETLVTNIDLFRVLELLLIKISEKPLLGETDVSSMVQILSIIALFTKDNEKFRQLVLENGLLNSFFFLLSLENHVILEHSLAVLVNISAGSMLLKLQLTSFGIFEILEQMIDTYCSSKKPVALGIVSNCAKILINLTSFDYQNTEFDDQEASESIASVVARSDLLLRVQLLLSIQSLRINILGLKFLSNFLSFSDSTDFTQLLVDYDFLKLARNCYIDLLLIHPETSPSLEKYSMCSQLFNIIGIIIQDLSKRKELVVKIGFLLILVNELNTWLDIDPKLTRIILLNLLFLSSTNSRQVQREFNLYKTELRTLFRKPFSPEYSDDVKAIVDNISLNIEL